MRIDRLQDMTKGWFVGDFEPTIIKTEECEMAVKMYSAGDSEERHYHKVATEVTVIVSGKARMNGQEFEAGDIVTMAPGESTDFHAITDVVTAVAKVPSVKGDKYLGDGE